MTGTCCEAASCNDMLCTLMEAYLALMSGSAAQEVDFDGDRTRYHPGNIAELKATIHRLHATCGNQASAALLGLGATGRRSPARLHFGAERGPSRC